MPATHALRILVADDHADTLSMLTRLLKLRGYDVRAARTVAEAVALADCNPCDLLISDLGLPDGCGEDLMRALKAKYGLKGVAVSGYASPADIEAARAAGFDEFLSKPVEFAQLLQVVSGLTSIVPNDGAGDAAAGSIAPSV